MTIEEVKKLAKDECGKDITDDQAREVLNKAQAGAQGELSDGALEAVSGGFNWDAAVKGLVLIGLSELSKL